MFQHRESSGIECAIYPGTGPEEQGKIPPTTVLVDCHVSVAAVARSAWHLDNRCKRAPFGYAAATSTVWLDVMNAPIPARTRIFGIAGLAGVLIFAASCLAVQFL